LDELVTVYYGLLYSFLSYGITQYGDKVKKIYWIYGYIQNEFYIAEKLKMYCRAEAH
jgi:hypothetical protein